MTRRPTSNRTLLALLLACAPSTAVAQSVLQTKTSTVGGGERMEAHEISTSTSTPENPKVSEDRPGFVQVRAVAEAGFLAVLSHVVQFSNSGTEIDYVDDGGQDVLFPVLRFSVELGLGQNHRVILLYQPLELRSTTLLSRDLIIDDLTFPAGTATAFRYSFPFWRVSWMYDFLDNPRDELAFGVSLQIRNAAIEFASLDGSLFRANRNIGPVPILKFRGRTSLSDSVWIGAEIDGFYAPISVINGSDNEVTGAIIDASGRVGLRVSERVDAFFNVRWLGGGAVGTSDIDGPGDGYVKNWLHFLTVSLGLSYDAL